jgi:radical SAM superfamily enzyme YgiQ (UPF0313 family)
MPEPSILLVGPYDPSGGEYTFLSPPLGVWRLAGTLNAAGFTTVVFDPNCCENGSIEQAFAAILAERAWSVIGFSTTGMTLRYDLALAHHARLQAPNAVLIAGGMEATFNADALFQLCPFDLLVLGEGERPLLELGARLRTGAPLEEIRGTAWRDPEGRVQRLRQTALTREELRDAILLTPYERMNYRTYWRKLEKAYRVRDLPVKADREARLAEIYAARLITLNYCPLGCTFCSSTNFLNAAQGGTARIARLDADECLTMIRRIMSTYPDVRTIIFQDDIFVFTTDNRVVPLCEGIVQAKRRGEIPRDLQFISTNRVDAMTSERLVLLRKAGFRVLGFGIENISLPVLTEFRKARIFPYIKPMLEEALRLGITPFLDLILTSPNCQLADIAETLREGYRWTLAGCEAGMYPYVIPFAGAAMSRDQSLVPQTIYQRQFIDGTTISWEQPTKILPADDRARNAILAIEADFEERLAFLETRVAHLPSRVRSLLWVASGIPILAAAGEAMPDLDEATAHLVRRLPGIRPGDRSALFRMLKGVDADTAA